jgi:hypothetical protein
VIGGRRIKQLPAGIRKARKTMPSASAEGVTRHLDVMEQIQDRSDNF